MPCLTAGSAIAQGPYVGRIDMFSEWEPAFSESLWLLLAGASDPPKDVEISKRRPRDNPGVRSGEFLAGVTHDLLNMEAAVGTKLFNTVKDLYLTKSRALEHISNLFDECNDEEVEPMLYYTGHGEIGTGNWCFSDGTVSIQEIIDILPVGTYYPMIFSDACYSGHWANFCLEKNIPGFHCLAACPEYSTAIDTRGEGGDLTLFMTGKKPRPDTEPMYSEGNIDDHPITSGYHESVEYTDFISSYVKNSENILICQSMCDGYFSGCFAPSRRYSPAPHRSWGIRRNYDSFLELVKKKWKRINGKSKNIYSLACDESLGFGAFFIQGYGTSQTIVKDTSDIEKKYDEGFEITACAARGCTFYVIMTKNTEEYKDKEQIYFTHSTWAKAEAEIEEANEEGYVITGICYSTGRKRYFVVMTETPQRQDYKWFSDKRFRARNKWLDKQHEKGFHLTIIFKDPTDDMTLVVVTEDKKRSGYIPRFNYNTSKYNWGSFSLIL